jgi:O-antigen biosynthesis protein
MRASTNEVTARMDSAGQKNSNRVSVPRADAESKRPLKRPVPGKSGDYGLWVAKNDTVSRRDRTAIRAHIAGLPYRPLISVIMAMGETSEIALRQSLESVVTQLYPYWELCIAVDYQTEALGQAIVDSSTAQDPRINFIRSSSLRAEGTTNTALRAATGDFVAFLRGGDTLPEHALYEVLVAILANSSVEILYTDYDEIDASGIRSNPWFKPGWDPDLLLAQDYLNDLTVYRRVFLEQVGLLHPELEGAAFYDLALRATVATTPDRIVHVPAVLYHRRDRRGATCGSREQTSAIVARRAVRDHLDSRGYRDVDVESAPSMPNANRIIWPLPQSLPLVSVIIPTRDRAELLAQCVEGVLHRTDYANIELLIVDNDSTEPATQALFERLVGGDRRVRVLQYPGPFNYSALNNAAAREAKGEILLLLNNDIDVIESGWLREMISHALRPDVGIVGAKLLYANEQIQHAGVVLGPGGNMHHLYCLANKDDPGYFGQLTLARTLSAVTGACAAIRRSVFWEVGGLDDTNLAIAFNDIDLCLRLGDHGYRVVWTPFAELFHLESASRGPDDSPTKKALFLREWQYMRKTWGSLLESGDPFHNPNLLFAGGHIEIPSSPRREKPWRSLTFVIKP